MIFWGTSFYIDIVGEDFFLKNAKEKYPGNYTLKKSYNEEKDLYIYTLVFEDSEEELLFNLKYT